jgi:hypothetical protein
MNTIWAWIIAGGFTLFLLWVLWMLCKSLDEPSSNKQNKNEVRKC